MIRPRRAVLVFLVFVVAVGAWLVTHPSDDAAPYSHVTGPVSHPAPTVVHVPGGSE